MITFQADDQQVDVKQNRRQRSAKVVVSPEVSESEEEALSQKGKRKRKAKVVFSPALTESEEDDLSQQKQKRQRPGKRRASMTKPMIPPKRKKGTQKVSVAFLHKKKNKRPSVGGSGDESENVLDYSDDDITSSEDEVDPSEVSWVAGGWTFDPRLKEFSKFGPKLRMELAGQRSFIDYFFQFFPSGYVREDAIPALNTFARSVKSSWVDVTFEEFIHVLAILYSMEVQQLPERRFYWNEVDNGIFKALNYGELFGVSRHRFEDILRFLRFSQDEDMDDQILSFLDAVNVVFKESMIAGDTLVVDESMVVNPDP